ncbi:hypothetical protein [Amycolatopsis magusensis]|uniref:Uncharacterized protein n=1 Tax=Amycolatopsis magusensis TaxID=882444 RepID=A0ABS4PX72_9PSEU|nr:hypothetical protein [Amycolatopsis magusensis]MBP2183444.1 hypothetical protein [Amycolatopsis magusensis]
MTESGLAPDGSASALAAAHDLGEWAQATYVAKKRLFSQRWADARLHFFARGLVITGPDGFEAAYDWASARVLQSITTVNGGVADARYTLIDPGGAAVSIGRGNDLLLARQRDRLGITTLVRGAPFTYEGTWGPHIQQSITEAQSPGTLAALTRGGTADFGPVKLTREGVSVKNRAAAWPDLEGVHPSNGLLTFAGAHRLALPPVPTHEIINLYLLLDLCRQLGRTQ